jgi:epoxyqueuosine reductase
VTRKELSLTIKQAALDVGFSAVGITSAEPFTEAADRFDAWVAHGSHGMMKYLERGSEKRRDIKNILPSAKSILSVALNYYHPQKTPATGDFKISRYAWGEDYHEVMSKMLESLLQKIKELAPQTEGRYYVDTGPLLEKEIAERAGIGWIGKHTNVITREYGSWVFLGEIILSLELDPDIRASDLCGTCNKCIEACPTDAITGPYQLDATKCIPYLTIELKAENIIPTELAAKMEGWVYGCDICQDVCPWNRFEKESPLSAFAPRTENLSLDINSILSMEQEEFSKRFTYSPVKRTKLAGLKRNIKAILGL